MKKANGLRLFLTAIMFTFMAGFVQEEAGSGSPESAIDDSLERIGVLDLPLTYDGITSVANSPDGDLEVAHYKDSEGRSFFVEPESNQVVDIDARGFCSPSRR